MPRLMRRSVGITTRAVLPLTGGYRIPRPGSRTGFDSAGERRRAARAVHSWPVTSSQIPRTTGAFETQRRVVSKDARRKGQVAASPWMGDASADE